MTAWETVIGLEVHAELATGTKLFSACANTFGGEPNTNVDPVSLGLPGTLPVVNEKAIEYAIRIGLALNCTVQRCVFARKNYFYPDMPKDYQISQFDEPLNVDGWLELPDGKRIGIERAHVEEDTGKTTHVGGDGRIHDAAYSLVDYNRAGVPLVEIVGRPDLPSAVDARSFVEELRSVLVAIGVSDGKMEEGSLRVDANVSVRPSGSDELRTRCEIKNVNSLRSIERAIDYEARRHVDLYENGEAPHQETRHWDEEGNRTRSGRSKEDSDDYRYFPDPDLVPIDPTPEWIDEIAAGMPLLPAARRARLATAGDVDPIDVSVVVERGHDDFAMSAIDAGADAGRALVHLQNNLADGLGSLTPQSFADLIAMEGGELSSTQAKVVLADLVASGGDPRAVASAHGFEAMDTGELEELLDRLVAEHPDEWDRLRSGDDGDRKKMQGFFTGQIMRATKGQADGKVVNQLLSRRT